MSGFDVRWDADRQEWFAFDGARMIACKDKSKLEELLDYVAQSKQAKMGPPASYWQSKFEALERAMLASGQDVGKCDECGCRIVKEGNAEALCVECIRQSER